MVAGKGDDHRCECQRHDRGDYRKAGYRMIFWQFSQYGFPVMVSSVAFSVLYLRLVFLC